MRKIRIYVDIDINHEDVIHLPEDASHHIRNVLRMKTGDALILFNNQSNSEYSANIQNITKKSVSVKIGTCENSHRESPLKTHLLQGLTKNDAMDFSLQKATELGVSEITPIICEHSQFSFKGIKLEKKMLHWQRIIINAAQQCWRYRLPKLNTPISAEQSWALNKTADRNLILNTTESENRINLFENNSETQSVNIWIGPEGGFSNQESELAQSHNIESLHIGPRILKSETATTVGLTLIQYAWGDFK